jgi:hypothetical protein
MARNERAKGICSGSTQKCPVRAPTLAKPPGGGLQSAHTPPARTCVSMLHGSATSTIGSYRQLKTTVRG